MINLPAPLVEQSQLMGNLITAFTPVRLRVPLGPHYSGAWLTLVYDRIGTNVPLDLSMRSLALLYNGIWNRDTRVLDAGRRLYVDALRNLRDDLSTGRASQSDIQSSVMLLTFYEVLFNRTALLHLLHHC